MAYLGIIYVVLILLLIRIDTDHRNGEIYQAIQIGVLRFMSHHYHLSVVPDILTVWTNISHRNSRTYGLPTVRALH